MKKSTPIFSPNVTKHKLGAKSEAEIEILRSGGRELSRILSAVALAVRPGVTTLSLDALARDLIRRVGGEPAFLDYRPAGAGAPFPAALCVSVNDEVVHGIPGPRTLEEGDLVSLDLGIKYRGFYTDMAVTAPVGIISPAAQTLLDVTKGALADGIAAARAGARTGDIGHAVAAAIGGRREYGIVTEFGGHGVGYRVHEPPEIPNAARQGSGARLVPGLVIAIEPMVTLGDAAIVTANDGWTVRTRSGSLAAHFEHTVLVTEKGPEILTAY